MWTVTKEFSFEAAHSLPHLPPEHKCHHLHGHSYKFTVVCQGDLVPGLSWVVDYAEITAAVEPLIQQLDHKNINDVLMITTTAENLAFWIYHGERRERSWNMPATTMLLLRGDVARRLTRQRGSKC